jgi:RNA polymerase sigma-54 factor
MALEIKLQQKLSQNLVLTPQLQQAIKLLQLGHQDYVEVVERELLENPALEESSADPSETRVDSEKDHTELSFSDSAEEGDRGDVRRESKTEEFEFNGQFYENARKGNAPSDAVSALEGTISSPEGLSAHLEWQIQTSDLDPQERAIASYIIGNLDQNGFLEIDLNEVAISCGVSVESCEKVLRVIHTLDPIGVGARDLKECLLIQLDAYGKRDTLVWRVVDNHLGDLEVRNYEAILKREHTSKEELYDAIREVQSLEPRPARSYSVDPPQYICPDVYVKKVGKDYVISLNDSGLPKITLSKNCQDLISKNTKSLNGEEKTYLQDKIKAAQWLIKSIHQRQQTIYKVTESVMKQQREFLEKGVSGLKPLVLREVADDVGLHESTISRVTSNKYVHTPHGVYELKFFFSSGLSSGEGDISSEVVKDRIKDMVSKEDAKKPLSDQQLVTMLKTEGIDVARRTVAKYREMLGILSSSRRKKIF